MLHIDPQIGSRLEEIETDLLARQSRAQAEGWLGEIEGIEPTLTFLRDKREQAHKLGLGMPGTGRQCS
ncbi:hypothetical protein [Nocardia brevicatena]|uniref:hypothetical protein n=1 Tax=Nocardia brevicatena TaxID=37327 RepID=UPI0002E7A82C|nr:hypothetical protein [Nocardia brevicatena]